MGTSKMLKQAKKQAEKAKRHTAKPTQKDPTLKELGAYREELNEEIRKAVPNIKPTKPRVEKANRPRKPGKVLAIKQRPNEPPTEK